MQILFISNHFAVRSTHSQIVDLETQTSCHSYEEFWISQKIFLHLNHMLICLCQKKACQKIRTVFGGEGEAKSGSDNIFTLRWNRHRMTGRDRRSNNLNDWKKKNFNFLQGSVHPNIHPYTNTKLTLLNKNLRQICSVDEYTKWHKNNCLFSSTFL